MDNSSEEEEEMALNRKRGLRKLLVDKKKGLEPKDASGSQPPLALPFHSPLSPINQFIITNLKKKRKEKGGGGVLPLKGA